ncbi:MAG TPA: response regulator [Crinalium sp.]
MVHSKRLHGQIWQAVLKSQKISVILEAPEVNLLENISQIKDAGLDLPHALLVDVGLRNFNPFAFCRWCRDNCPDVKVILLNPSQQEISPSERQWAILQGAADLLPGFDLDNLVSSVADEVKRVLKALDGQPLDNGALISVLLAMKRELDLRRGASPDALRKASVDLSKRNGKLASPPPDDALNLPQLPASNSSSKPQKEERSLLSKWMNGVQLPGRSDKSAGSSNQLPPEPGEDNSFKDLEPLPKPDKLPPDDEPPPVRKYRGKAY